MEVKNEIPRRGYSIRIFLAEGTPFGLKFVEKSNWSGLGVVCPRPRFSVVKEREEFGRAGVYVLLGPSESSDVPIGYIGEADPVRGRLEQHHSQRDFWTTAYFFTSKDTNLNKAHIKYLEYRLIVLAQSAKRCQLQNKSVPSLPSLSEADRADVETFLDELLLCFPVLGVSIFEKPPSKAHVQAFLIFTRRGVSARGYESEDGFIVAKGSMAASEVVESMQPYAQGIRNDLIKAGVLVKKGDYFEFAQDYEFASPSTAASVVAGASVNGRDSWKTDDGVTLKQLQEKSGESLLIRE